MSPVPNQLNNSNQYFSITMKTNLITKLTFAAVLCSVSPSFAHTSYGGSARDLGTVSGTSITPYFKTITNQTVTSDFGWAAGTSPLFGDAHDIKAYRFTLAEAGLATITVSAANRGSGLGTFYPAFSLYSGLLHTNGISDYDTALVTQEYLASLGDPQPRRGAFDALDTWKMGNDAGELSTLSYVGNAADGSASTFGTASGINGDGLADGFISASFWLPAGDYSLMIGGANLAGSDETGTYGIDVGLGVIPEPSSMLLGGLGALCLFARRNR